MHLLEFQLLHNELGYNVMPRNQQHVYQNINLTKLINKFTFEHIVIVFLLRNAITNVTFLIIFLYLWVRKALITVFKNMQDLNDTKYPLIFSFFSYSNMCEKKVKCIFTDLPLLIFMCAEIF